MENKGKNIDAIMDVFLAKKGVKASEGFIDEFEKRLAREKLIEASIDKLLRKQRVRVSEGFTDSFMAHLGGYKMGLVWKALFPVFLAVAILALAFMALKSPPVLSNAQEQVVYVELASLDARMKDFAEYSKSLEDYDPSRQSEDAVISFLDGDEYRL